MGRKSYKQKYDELLQQSKVQANDARLEEHTDYYIHIPKPNLLCLLGLIVTGLLAYGNLMLIITASKIFNVDFFATSQPVQNLVFMPNFILEYAFISLAIISLVALFRGGYDRLKWVNLERGSLISGLIIGLIIGLIFGLIFGLIGLMCEFE